MRRALLVALWTTGLIISARAQSPAPLAAQAAPTTLVRTELYFGRIAPEKWRKFLAQVVTPRFPDGLTWYDSHGQWQNRDGVLTKEDSRVMIVIHALTAEKSRLIDEVRHDFMSRYHEQSVLRADEMVKASF